MVCKAKEFQLNDGICDDATNIAICGYDGGDCCREQKLTHLCNECQCILDIDEDLLKLKLHKVMMNKQSNNSLHFSAIKTVEYVVSSFVCALLCLDKSAKNNIDSWIFETTNSKNTCTCTRLDETCIEYEGYETVTLTQLDGEVLFLMSTLVPQCGKFASNNNITCFKGNSFQSPHQIHPICSSGFWVDGL